MIDYQKMNEKELLAIIDNAEKALRNLQHNKRKEVIAQMKELAASINVNLEISEADKKTSVRQGAIVPIKYRHPDDPEKTWKGRGVMPKWLQTLLDEGHDRSEFEVSN